MTDLDELKRANPIVDVLSQLGHEPPDRWNGSSDFTIACPLPTHDDTTPSCRIHPGSGRFHCFGCGEHGDVLDLVQQVAAIRNFSEVIAWFANRGVRVPLGRRAARAPASGTDVGCVLEINDQAWAIFTTAGRAALAARYLAARGLDTAWAATSAPTKSLVGYTPAARNGLMLELRGSGFTDREIIDAGWAIGTDGGLIDRFHRRVVFPIRDHDGSLVGVTARDTSGLARAKYLNTPTTPAFRKSEHIYDPVPVSAAETVVVCEGPIDALAVRASRSGTTSAVALCGTAMSTHQAMRIASLGSRIELVPDGDEAGHAAAARWKRVLEAVGVTPRLRELPPGVDPATSRNLGLTL